MKYFACSLSRVVAAAVVAAGLASPAVAVHCVQEWTKPVACELRLAVKSIEGGEREIGDEGAVRVSPGERFTIVAAAYDQAGRLFPSERLLYGWSFGPACRTVLSLSEHDVGELAGEARTTGTCRVTAWIPGNANLDRTLTISVVPTTLSALVATYPDAVANSLYSALLGRDARVDDIRNLRDELRRDGLDQEVRKMCASREYRQRAQRLDSQSLLASFYRGFLGREPGAHADPYRARLAAGDCAGVALDLLNSEEYRRRLVERAHEVPSVSPR